MGLFYAVWAETAGAGFGAVALLIWMNLYRPNRALRISKFKRYGSGNLNENQAANEAPSSIPYTHSSASTTGVVLGSVAMISRKKANVPSRSMVRGSGWPRARLPIKKLPIVAMSVGSFLYRLII